MFVSSGGVSCQRCGAVGDADGRFCARCGGSMDVSGAVRHADPMVGRWLGGGYTLKELLGVGGMGRVYRAEQEALGRTVAVKVVHPHLLNDERTVARFYREARAASRLNHPHSVCVIDFGRSEDGILYLVMEHLEGRDLADILAHESMLPLARVCRIVEQILEALAEAHALGIVHRDLKPENILVTTLRTGGDLVKVVDFGLATIVDQEPTKQITLSGSICGTAEYMSPEQIRGAPTDARSDLYAMGALLFELLTGSPPFAAPSPAKIVFRHLRDPVPDPREMVPLRNIPPDLAAIAMRALQKKADERFQSAQEMLTQLREVSARLGATGRKCGACGARSPGRRRFCGVCGERLPRRTTLDTAPPTAPPRITAYPQAPVTEVLLGRDGELRQLEEARQRAMGETCWVHLVGDPGIGKTRLLTEVGRSAAACGDLVVGAMPHPSRAPVAYAPIRHLVSRLTDIPERELARLDSSADCFDEPLARAGVRELTEPTGLAGVEGQSRIGAVTAALACALHRARRRSASGRILLLVDDLPHCDGLTARVLDQLRERCASGTLILTTGRPSRMDVGWAQEMPLLGLDDAAQQQFFAQLGDASAFDGAGHGRFLLPLYLEQVRALGATRLEEGGIPVRLADAISRRLQRLEVEPTRVLQAVAVLGDRCPREWLDAVLDPLDEDSLEGLVAEGLLRPRSQSVEIVHPFIRDLILASIPSEARHALHVRALRVAVDHGAPLEVRAEHAFGSGEAMGAMVVLEQMGEQALRRGDTETAVLAFRRALETARRAMMETGDLLLEGAIATFSRKLGTALARKGDHAGAEGVLREALDLAPPQSVARARMLLALGEALGGRERARQAERMLRQALEIAVLRGETTVEGQAYQALGRLRRSASDWPSATDHLRRACDLYGRDPRTTHRRLLSLLELGQVLLDAGHQREAMRLSIEARRLAEEHGAHALAAMALATMARADVAGGHIDRAETLYHEAARLAAEAGAAEWHEEWARAARAPAA